MTIPAKIRVLIVDAAAEAHQQIAASLANDSELEVAGSTSDGQEAVEALPALRPDVALVDLGLPGLDGLHTTETITARYPWVSVIMTSTAADPDYLRRAMLAGARHFLVKPIDAGELTNSIKQVYWIDAGRRAAQAAAPPPVPGAAALHPGVAVAPARESKVYTFYSAKGGVGCTTIACNLAIALKQATGKEVAIFDCGLLFGDVGVVLNLSPRYTLVDLLPRLGNLHAEDLDQMMATHTSGVKILLAPPSPEKAELVSAEHVRAVLAALRERFDYVLIDTWPTFEERILHVLDASDKIVVLTTLEMPAIKNTRLLLDVTNALSYPPERIALVVNRADSRGSIRMQDVERILQKQFAAEIVSDGRLTTHSLNEGVPFVMTRPDAPISGNVVDLARKLAELGAPPADEVRPRRPTGLLRAVLGV